MNPSRLASLHLWWWCLPRHLAAIACALWPPAWAQPHPWVALDCPGPTEQVLRYTYSKELEQVLVDGKPATHVVYLAGTFTFTTATGGPRLLHQLNVHKALLRIENPDTGERSALRRCTRVGDEPAPLLQAQ